MLKIQNDIATSMDKGAAVGLVLLDLSAAFDTIIIIIIGFIERKVDTNPLMRLSPRRESPGTDMGRHVKSARQGITKVGGMPVGTSESLAGF